MSRAVITPWATALSERARHEMDEGTNGVYKNFGQLYLAEKEGAQVEHAKSAVNELYVEIITDNNNRAGLYMGVSGDGKDSIQECVDQFAAAIVKLLDGMYGVQRHAELHASEHRA
jgi:hypothetical protein